PIEEATVASAASILATAPPKPVDRGDGLDGVPRRERSRADRPAPGARGGERRTRGPRRDGERDSVQRVADVGTGRKTHRKGKSPRTVAEDEWTPRGRPPRGAKPGPARAGKPTRSGRPSAKPGRRPAGAGAARPGRPARGNARRKKR